MFISIPVYFLISFLTSFSTHGFFRSMLFNFHVFTDFLVVIMLLLFNLILLWKENIFSMISTLLNFWGLFSSTGHSLSQWMFHGYLKKFCTVVGWSLLHMPIRSHWLTVLIKYSISLLTFLSSVSISCWEGVLKSLVIIAYLSTSPFSSMRFYFLSIETLFINI